MHVVLSRAISPLSTTQPTSSLSRLRPPPVHHHFDQENETSKLDEDDIPCNTATPAPISSPIDLGLYPSSVGDPLEE